MGILTIPDKTISIIRRGPEFKQPRADTRWDLPLPPARPFGTVLDQDAAGGQFGARRIGRRKVPALAGGDRKSVV